MMMLLIKMAPGTRHFALIQVTVSTSGCIVKFCCIASLLKSMILMAITFLNLYGLKMKIFILNQLSRTVITILPFRFFWKLMEVMEICFHARLKWQVLKLVKETVRNHIQGDFHVNILNFLGTNVNLIRP